ncbi:patellin-3-like [Abrus precatorius]|uniref:Patellin-3-like n=1 Tax=Abrus precatorius TaxID=3816 RepID=A0A8B8MJR2_ABRPR|nr:patellin-3-like [Abrus precatorius]
MAEEASKTPTTQEEVVVTTNVALADTTTDTGVAKDTEEEASPEKKKLVEEEKAPETVVSKSSGDDNNIPESGSFKEESTRVSDLPDTEKKALQELKHLIQEALNNHELNPPKEEKTQDNVDNKEKSVEEGKEHVSEHAAADVAPPPPSEQDQTTNKEEVEEEGEGKKKEPVAETPEVKNTQVVENKAGASTVDDDGTKTVEAIEETVVAVAVSSSPSVEPEGAKVEKEEASVMALVPEEVSIWGVPLLADERSDVILLKFLRARDFKVKEAFAMIKNTIRWRKEFMIEELLEESFGDDLEKAVFMHGFDKEGHPVCYNIYGEFQNKELYKKTFSDEEKRHKFLRWRIQFLEKSIRKLDFNPGGISTIVQVNDLKNSPGPGKWELRQATKQALHLLQDNYPEFVAKQVFINVPWWYLAVNRMISPFLTQRTKSKFVFAGPSKSAETLLRYIAAEQLPVKYGGLSKDGEFRISDAVTEITVRPAAKHTVEFPVTENCLLSWELRVIGWEVSYGAEFIPSSEGSYTVIIQKARKVASSEEPVLCNNYKIGEPGKVVLTIENQSSKKKKLLYRLKVKPSSD